MLDIDDESSDDKIDDEVEDELDQRRFYKNRRSTIFIYFRKYFENSGSSGFRSKKG